MKRSKTHVTKGQYHDQDIHTRTGLRINIKVRIKDQHEGQDKGSTQRVRIKDQHKV
jgi:hypothetical protein